MTRATQPCPRTLWASTTRTAMSSASPTSTGRECPVSQTYTQSPADACMHAERCFRQSCNDDDAGITPHACLAAGSSYEPACCWPCGQREAQFADAVCLGPAGPCRVATQFTPVIFPPGEVQPTTMTHLEARGPCPCECMRCSPTATSHIPEKPNCVGTQRCRAEFLHNACMQCSTGLFKGHALVPLGPMHCAAQRQSTFTLLSVECHPCRTSGSPPVRGLNPL